ncbi:MAG: glycosyltransferase family 2 protein [Caulobacteraceae bacterium]
MAPPPPPASPEISVIVPVLDEVAAAPPLAREIAAAFAGVACEILFVDDASADGTGEALATLTAEIPTLRVLRHGRNAGQSRAIRTGALAARGDILVTLDGDGQNDPADAPALVQAIRDGPASLGLVGGERRGRKDSAAKRWASRAANAIRRRVLNDGAVDTGCGLKAMRREAFLRLPYFDHMHRYLPALMRREGYGVAFRPVGHRPRRSGRSKYDNLGRLRAAILDLAGVMWLRRRGRSPGEVGELARPKSVADCSSSRQTVAAPPI